MTVATCNTPNSHSYINWTYKDLTSLPRRQLGQGNTDRNKRLSSTKSDGHPSIQKIGIIINAIEALIN